jgi:hypothetical protein
MEETNASAIAKRYAEHISGNGVSAKPFPNGSIEVQFDNLSTNEIHFGSVNEKGWHATAVNFEENYVVIKCYDRQPYMEGEY